MLKGKVENKMHREFPAPVERQKTNECCWPVADLDLAFQPLLAYAALRSKLRHRSEYSCSWGKGCQEPAVRSPVLTDRISPTLSSSFSPLHWMDNILVLLLNGLIYYPCSVVGQA